MTGQDLSAEQTVVNNQEPTTTVVTFAPPPVSTSTNTDMFQTGQSVSPTL